MPKENGSCKCLSLIMLNSVVKIEKKYYPQTLLEYETKKIKMENLINDELKAGSSDDETDETESENKIMMNPMNNLLKIKKVF